MSSIIPFDFEGAAVRTMSRDGEPWFVLADVCRVLGLTDPSGVARKLDADEKGQYPIRTLGGEQNVLAVNESGLFAVILRSDKPDAKRFRKWITSEVLPAIRHTGGYIQAAPEDTPEIIMAKGLLAANEAMERLSPGSPSLSPRRTPWTALRTSLAASRSLRLPRRSRCRLGTSRSG